MHRRRAAKKAHRTAVEIHEKGKNREKSKTTAAAAAALVVVLVVVAAAAEAAVAAVAAATVLDIFESNRCKTIQTNLDVCLNTY